ncbi:hypothetical protein M406DRAFT_70615 [Cryphonectria parasitica EP155]|uniref:Uncharacterized protein n=1 Tax=Cryphonectria parasitica (strain ATCC 38755 / EP155) TaxID=660469 RepID=A0A9P5CPC5_CRYP1|nr:uncharacterized protein M406DRAFT_70615 [Cryphonectria parasitica EP155]KAF3764870.1 hypothetical protein M406DRAFT_70615 [Cryphonectria parasitica EP155]
MQFITAILALAATTSAASITRRQSDPHMIDFRSYGAAGCSADNQGVYTYEQSDASTCFPFSTELDVESVLVLDITLSGCSFYVYSDAECATEAIPVAAGECYDATSAGLGSYQTICS